MSYPQWQHHFDPHRIEPERQFWLAQNESTTKLLQQRYPKGAFKVKLCYAGWNTLHPDEALYLNQPDDRYWIREVVLRIHDHDFMWARSVFSQQSLAQMDIDLRRIDTTPLGAIIFQDPNLQRSAFEYALLKPHDKHYCQSMQQYQLRPPKPLWARRSILRFQNGPFYLAEVPLLTAAINHSPPEDKSACDKA